MNAVETLQAAIDRLEKLKTESTPGPWFYTYEKSRWPRVWGNQDDDDADAVAQTEGGVNNAYLIVTLHRTIDAQLEILRDVLNAFRDPIPMFRGFEKQIFAAQIELAEAILGGAS